MIKKLRLLTRIIRRSLKLFRFLACREWKLGQSRKLSAIVECSVNGTIDRSKTRELIFIDYWYFEFRCHSSIRFCCDDTIIPSNSIKELYTWWKVLRASKEMRTNNNRDRLNISSIVHGKEHSLQKLGRII